MRGIGTQTPLREREETVSRAADVFLPLLGKKRSKSARDDVEKTRGFASAPPSRETVKKGLRGERDSAVLARLLPRWEGNRAHTARGEGSPHISFTRKPGGGESLEEKERTGHSRRETRRKGSALLTFYFVTRKGGEGGPSRLSKKRIVHITERKRETKQISIPPRTQNEPHFKISL